LAENILITPNIMHSVNVAEAIISFSLPSSFIFFGDYRWCDYCPLLVLLWQDFDAVTFIWDTEFYTTGI